MRARFLLVFLCSAAQALTWAAVLPARADDRAKPPLPTPAPKPNRATQAASVGAAAPASQSPGHPVVQIIRVKLADPGICNGANAVDLAALQTFYAARSGGPLWMTEMGFTAKGQGALFEIGEANDWGLDTAAFDLPAADALPANHEAQALAEIKLDLAILKYARFARGGRFNPSEISNVLDQRPSLRDPKFVLSEIAAASAPDLYLKSLHPRHEQFVRLRDALLKARQEESENGKPKLSELDIKRLVINMERWRWMPEDLGTVYVWLNTPEFMLYVIKDGKTIFRDKTLVGTIGYFTPVFSVAEVLLVEDKKWPESKVKTLWDKGLNSPVTLDHKFPRAYDLFHGSGRRRR